MNFKSILPKDFDNRVQNAIAHYWLVRNKQYERQIINSKTDQGLRSAVTGGAQLDGFVELFSYLAYYAGIPQNCIFNKKTKLELPGFFRPTKEWDLLIIKNRKLIAAIETKSQAGPSFCNNFNNRTEEAMGSALDLWTAFKKGIFSLSVQPFVGYLFMLENCSASNCLVKVREPHFPVLNEFRIASYTKRYELFCKKIVQERLYTAASFITSTKSAGINGEYQVPLEELSIRKFSTSFICHIAGQV